MGEASYVLSNERLTSANCLVYLDLFSCFKRVYYTTFLCKRHIMWLLTPSVWCCAYLKDDWLNISHARSIYDNLGEYALDQKLRPSGSTKSATETYFGKQNLEMDSAMGELYHQRSPSHVHVILLLETVAPVSVIISVNAQVLLSLQQIWSALSTLCTVNETSTWVSLFRIRSCSYFHLKE